MSIWGHDGSRSRYFGVYPFFAAEPWEESCKSKILSRIFLHIAGKLKGLFMHLEVVRCPEWPMCV